MCIRDRSDAQVLYNGTSGAVKGITAAMLEDGTAAVAYTLDADCRDTTTADREIAYAVIDVDGTVSRNVQTTNDSYLDENPQPVSYTHLDVYKRQWESWTAWRWPPC